jgi:hypothetical protein
MKLILEAITEENYENVMAWDGGCDYWQFEETIYIYTYILVILSEENHENLRVSVGGCVHWHLKKLYSGNSI